MGKSEINFFKPNRVWRTYFGGSQLDVWQGNDLNEDLSFPEEWIASDVKASNPGREHIPDEGLSLLRGKYTKYHTLRELLISDPIYFLGEKHFNSFGNCTGVLAKIIDSANRLTIQVHPDKDFAKKYLNSSFGKTESWYIIGGRKINNEEPYVLFGFKEYITQKLWKNYFEEQNISGMIDSLHKVYIKPGEIYFIEAGVPHAIGPGCFLLEVQEPTDFTLRTEKQTPEGVAMPDKLIHQGAGFENLMQAFHYEGTTFQEMKKKWMKYPVVSEETPEYTYFDLISKDITLLFSLHQVKIKSSYNHKPDGRLFTGIILKGQGKVKITNGEYKIKQGDTFFIPAGSESVEFISENNSALDVIFIRPPLI